MREPAVRPPAVNLRPHFTTDTPHWLTPLLGGPALVIASFQTDLVVLPATIAKYCGRASPERSKSPKSGDQKACHFLVLTDRARLSPTNFRPILLIAV
jgi:hypothetical protein